MIQRIQSFLLVLAVCGCVLLFLFPIATYTSGPEANIQTRSELNLIPKDYRYVDDAGMDGVPVFIGQKNHKPSTIPLAILAIAMGLVGLISIFLYKNRVRQMRWVAVAFMLNVIYIGLIFLFYADKYAVSLVPEIGSTVPATNYSVGTWIPIVTVILFFLSQRCIRRDEMKVRAADRLR